MSRRAASHALVALLFLVPASARAGLGPAVRVATTGDGLLLERYGWLTSLQTTPAGTLVGAGMGGFVFRSLDGGSTWWSAAGPGKTVLGLSVGPPDRVDLLIGAAFDYRHPPAPYDPVLWRSLDGGVTFTQTGVPGPDVWWGAAMATSASGAVAVYGAGGVSATTDDGWTWTTPSSSVRQPATLTWTDAGTLVVCGSDDAAPGRLLCLRSTDAGRSFTPHPMGTPVIERVSLAQTSFGLVVLSDADVALSNDDGVTWTWLGMTPERGILAATEDDLWISGDSLVSHSSDGIAWTSQPGPFPCGGASMLAALPSGELVLGSGSRDLRRSADGGATWSRVTWPLPPDGPLALALTRLASGDLAAVWPEGLAGGDEVRAAVSADGGRTWSAPVTAAPDAARGYYYNSVDVAPVAAGGLQILWASSDDVGCSATSRTTGSVDGRTWTSTPVAITAGPTKIVEAAPGVLIATGSYGEVFRSADAGRTWSPTLGGLGMTNPVVTADGAVAFLHQQVTGAFVAARSTDGGLTWTERHIDDRSFYDGVLVRAGTRLLFEGRYEVGSISRPPFAFESFDHGITWSEIPPVWGTPVAGEATGSVDYVSSFYPPSLTAWITSYAPAGSAQVLGDVPMRVRPDLISIAPGRVGVLYWDIPPGEAPGVFYSETVPGPLAGPLRHAAVRVGERFGPHFPLPLHAFTGRFDSPFLPPPAGPCDAWQIDGIGPNDLRAVKSWLTEVRLSW